MSRRFAAAAALALPKLLVVDQMIRDQRDIPRLDGSGLLVVNAPYTLKASLEPVLDWLTPLLAREGGGRWRIDTLSES